MNDDCDYQSGPFCRHYGDPFECPIKCSCGHECHEHYQDPPGRCDDDGCACLEWTEDERPRDDNTIEQMTPDE